MVCLFDSIVFYVIESFGLGDFIWLVDVLAFAIFFSVVGVCGCCKVHL